jgi:hypothetical protein
MRPRVSAIVNILFSPLQSVIANLLRFGVVLERNQPEETIDGDHAAQAAE